VEHIYSNITTSISELKKSPTAILNAAKGEPVALLNNNKPTAYIIRADVYERLIEELDDMELLKIAETRAKDAEYVEVDLDDI
jgi:antitoxin StbD